MTLTSRVRVFALVCANLLSIGCDSRSADAEGEDGRLTGRARAGDADAKSGEEPNEGDAQLGDDANGTINDSQECDVPAMPCAFNEADVHMVAETSVSPEDPIALSVRADGSMLGWVAYERGLRRVSSLWFGEQGTSAQLSAPDRSSQQSAPSNAVTDLGFLSVWSDRENEGGDLFANVTFESGAQHGGSSRLTSDAADDQDPLVATGADGRLLVVYKARTNQIQGRALMVDPAGTPIGQAHELAPFARSASRGALASFLDGYLLAFIDDTTGHLMMMRLDQDGVAISEPKQVDADGNVVGQIDLTTSDVGGAIAYGVRVGGARAEVHVRTFDAKAAFTYAERSVAASDETAQAPQIEAFRGGFAVLYRAQQGATTSLRVSLLSAAGERIAASTVVPLADAGLATALQVSPDGQTLHFAWTDQVDSSGAYELRRATALCE